MHLTKSERILGLSKIWRDVRYNFARFYEVTDDQKWDALYSEFLPLVAECNSPLHYYELLMRFTTTLCDGHTYVIMPQTLYPPYNISIGTTYIDGKHILMEVPILYKNFLYAEILSVNEIPIEKFLQDLVFPLTWHQNMASLFSFGLLGYVIGCTKHEVIKISTDKGDFYVDNNCRGDTAQHIGTPKTPDLVTANPVFLSDNLDIVVSKDNIGVIIFKSCQNDVKDCLYNNVGALKNCKGFIVDVRRNTGGGDYSCSAVASLFFDHPVEGGKCFTRVHNAWEFANCKNNDLIALHDPPKRFTPPFCTDKPVVVLMGGCTASAAESFIIMMKNEQRAFFIGENSAGTTGQPMINSLPGGGSYAVCTQKGLTNEGVDYNNIGLEPDLYCHITLEDYQKNYDRVMDKGLEYIRKLTGN